MKLPAVFFDCDNTLLRTDFIWDEIRARGLKGLVKWRYFEKHCNGDRVQAVKGMKALFDVFKWQDLKIIICTARNERLYCDTAQKLIREGFYFDSIYMRDDNDLRVDIDTKRDLLKQIMKEYEIIAFIDDNSDNCRIAKELGILSLRRV